MDEEGYVKFQGHLKEESIDLDDAAFQAIINVRQELYKRNLIGMDWETCIGFGNVSFRHGDGDEFYITASGTGALKEIVAQKDFCLVTSVDIDKNTVYCRGPAMASSESMTHAMIYQQRKQVRCCLHVHSEDMWRGLLEQDDVPCTDGSVRYGTPEMCRETIKILTCNSDDEGVFVMQGHFGGLFAFATCETKALDVLLHWYQRFCNPKA